MSNIDTQISSALGITSKEIVQQIIDPKPASQAIVPRPVGDFEDADIDYKYSRENFYSLVERGQDAVTGILELAKESEHPRTYEVAGQLIKVVSEVTEKLADLQDKMKRLKEVPDHAPKNVTNALFVGSTKELQALLSNERSSIPSQIEKE